MPPIVSIIDVCIATYKRPALLKKLLMSLRTQKTNGEFTYTVIVVDNDVQRSAETIVREFETNGQMIIYDIEPEQNISLARNRALSHATGDYIATIDDDEYADCQWLLNLYKTIVSYKADAVFGAVDRTFDEKTPDYIRKSEAFDLPNPTTGSINNFVFNTANSLFRRKLIEHTATPFDPGFGRTGSGDIAFFQNLRKQGYKMVWCREALVFEFIPPERANWLWILKRDFRTGNTYYRVYDKGPIDLNLTKFGKIIYICKLLVRRCRPVPFYILVGIFNSQYALKAIKLLRKSAFYTGIMAYFLNFQYEEYRERKESFFDWFKWD